jgi:transcriptional regulator with XRE-family HTH domain
MSSSAVAAHLGVLISDARRQRAWTLRDCALRAGISAPTLHAIEHGRASTFETYEAIARALGRELRVDLLDPRRRSATRAEDPVHAAMGEVIARRLLELGHHVAIDEPYQHYQFAGRADVLAWDRSAEHLLHVENRTRFPNIQEAIGSYNRKRQYLPGVVAERLGRRHGFSSVTHVIAALWSSDAIHALRMHPATFQAVCPDDPFAFDRWWSGYLPEPGVTSSLILLDPDRPSARHRVFSPLEPATRPRYRDYAAAANALSRGAPARS